MRIGIDIDDVLYPWYETAHAICERAGITGGNVPTTWRPFDSYGCTDQQWFDVLAKATISGELYGARPMRGTVRELERLLISGHTIHLVTARGFMQHGNLIRSQTIDWLAAWGIPHHSLTFAKDKRAVITDLFLDDAAHNYDQLDDHTEVWLVHAPHNGDHREGRRVVESLSRFVDIAVERGA